MTFQPEIVTRINGAAINGVPMTLSVRKYTLDDVDTMVFHIKAFAEEHPFYRQLKFNEEKLRQILAHEVHNPRMYGGLVIHPIEGPIAGLGAMVMGYAMSDALYCHDMIQFVRPQYRDGQAWAMLINDYVSWARELGLHNVQLSFTVSSRENVMARALERWGFDYLGPIYAKVL